MSAENLDPIERDFVDPVNMSTVTLIVARGGPEVMRNVGVRHDGCDLPADVSPQLDAFYCHACGRNGRVSGGWVIDVMAGRA